MPHQCCQSLKFSNLDETYASQIIGAKLTSSSPTCSSQSTGCVQWHLDRPYMMDPTL